MSHRPAALAAGAALVLLATGAWPAESPGDAGRGRALFEAKGCARCHPSREQGAGPGPPLEVVRRPQGMYELSGRLWNHAPGMFAIFQKAGLGWPEIPRAQMADLMAYLQADAARDGLADRLRGQAVLVRKGCLKCHRLQGEGGAAAIELATYPGGYGSPVVWATAIWAHAPRMAGVAARLEVLYPRFEGDEMANLVEFLRSVAAAPR